MGNVLSTSRWMTSTLCSLLTLDCEVVESVCVSYAPTPQDILMKNSPLLCLAEASLSLQRRKLMRYKSRECIEEVLLCVMRGWRGEGRGGVVGGGGAGRGLAGSPEEMRRSLPIALFHTFPLTPGGKPCHHNSRTFRALCLAGRERERELSVTLRASFQLTDSPT